MSQQPDQHMQPSRNVFVRFQKGSNAVSINSASYGALLERVIAHRSAFINLADVRGGIHSPLLLSRTRLLPRDPVRSHSNAYAGAARNA